MCCFFFWGVSVWHDWTCNIQQMELPHLYFNMTYRSFPVLLFLQLCLWNGLLMVLKYANLPFSYNVMLNANTLIRIFRVMNAQLNSSLINCTSFNCSFLIIAGIAGLIGLSDRAIFPSIATDCFLWQTSPWISLFSPLFVCRFNSTLLLACHKS